MSLSHSALRSVRRIMWVCLLATGMASCMATTYGPLGVTGGFIDKIVDENTAVVVVSGNGFTPTEQVGSMLLLRAAELTLQNRHQRFSLLSIEDQGALDAQRAGRLNAYLRQKASRGQDGPALLIERTVVSNKYAAIPITKAGGGFFVVMYKGGGAGAYDARAIVADLRPKLVKEATSQAQSPKTARQ